MFAREIIFLRGSEKAVLGCCLIKFLSEGCARWVGAAKCEWVNRLVRENRRGGDFGYVQGASSFA